MSVIDERYVTVAEAAALLKVSRSTLWRWIDQGELPAYRLGQRRVLIKREDLGRLLTPARGTDPSGEKPHRGGGGNMTEIEREREWLSRPLTKQEQEKALAALEAAREFSAEMLRRRGGEPFSDSAEIVREMREERTRELS
jgi:excisionase family DNA binding protein